MYELCSQVWRFEILAMVRLICGKFLSFPCVMLGENIFYTNML
jgi:hypothetical protein